MLGEIGSFGGVLLGALASMLVQFAVALVLTGIALVLLFRAVKERLRARVTEMDQSLSEVAGQMRYTTPGDDTSDRVKWTWFFRFWTNFASAPSLSFWSLLVPFLAWHRALPEAGDAEAALLRVTPWLLPGVCYAGSMLLSFVLKRVFRRVRPPRKAHAFGYKLNDPSFPSGHSLTSFCFWMMLAVVVSFTNALPVFGVFFFSLFALLVPLLTGWSRVYLGVHFPSDVLGGFLIGATWCLMCFIAFPNLLV